MRGSNYQIREADQPKGYWVRIGVAREVDLLEAAKMEEARVHSTFNPTTSHIKAAAKIESNHVTCALITSDAFSRANVWWGPPWDPHGDGDGGISRTARDTPLCKNLAPTVVSIISSGNQKFNIGKQILS
ncbi:hypothetical protein AAC387_Pa07g1727 [Persea americana]